MRGARPTSRRRRRVQAESGSSASCWGLRCRWRRAQSARGVLRLGGHRRGAVLCGCTRGSGRASLRPRPRSRGSWRASPTPGVSGGAVRVFGTRWPWAQDTEAAPQIDDSTALSIEPPRRWSWSPCGERGEGERLPGSLLQGRVDALAIAIGSQDDQDASSAPGSQDLGAQGTRPCVPACRVP